ncbi:hypothetical protein M3C74_06090 [Micrococcus lylae]|uniref:hypothetical protein n=1 Tax=Micrococcus lylae TaxID=1273 RepID=UPI0021A32E38|nr:hypothetical protein [Micrococcus lylae]MCT2007651.1 hypothetical protein [Micrococcus lylae]MCT2071404.1 hypothetical protein [Micrococcus lylae]
MSVPDYFDTSTDEGRRAAARHRPDGKAWFGLPIPLVLGVGVGLLGFVITVSATTTRSVNDVVTVCRHTDFSAWLWAAATAVLGLVGLVHGMRENPNWTAPRWALWAMVAACAVMAVLHVLRGLGLIGDPCVDLIGTRP